MLLSYYVITLLCYYVTMLLCYYVIMLLCYYLIMILPYYDIISLLSWSQRLEPEAETKSWSQTRKRPGFEAKSQRQEPEAGARRQSGQDSPPRAMRSREWENELTEVPWMEKWIDGGPVKRLEPSAGATAPATFRTRARVRVRVRVRVQDTLKSNTWHIRVRKKQVSSSEYLTHTQCIEP